jgi:Do/DeqQ family serine protease
MSFRNLAVIALLSVASAGVGAALYSQLFDQRAFQSGPASAFDENALVRFPVVNMAGAQPADFTVAATITTPTVVHVKKTYTPMAGSYGDPFRDFFGDDFWPFRYESPGGGQMRQQVASGSGVIISRDGYIVTNNHVVSDADNIEVTLHDKRTYSAEVIGTDPSTDLALIKVSENDLPFIAFGNSDSVLIGEWVMAVGNPFDLTSTVTAGIVSAKGRNINILSEQSRAPIESFIQTDAAVNPGNSGGALVNLRGELVGINTAIATPTGTYAGYSFAVPVNIVRKVVRDLMDFGVVQRAFLGVNISDVTSELARELKLSTLSGAYVTHVIESSGAADAGLKEGDVITTVEGRRVNSVAELQERISAFRPGDKVELGIMRGDNPLTKKIVLKSSTNGTDAVTKEAVDVRTLLGADFADLSKKEKDDLNVEGGVKVTALYSGRLTQNTRVREGFIITGVDKKKVKSLAEFTASFQGKEKGDPVFIEGIYPNAPNETYYYAFGI